MLGILSVFPLAENSRADTLAAPSFKILRTKDLADDTKVEALLENSDPSDDKTRYKIGSVQKQQDGKQWLMVKGQKVFEGYNLSAATSSSDGTVAISSYSGLHNQIDGDGSDTIIDKKTGKLIQAISSVWIIDPSGTKHKITGDDMHATHPIISRDDKWVAFEFESGRRSMTNQILKFGLKALVVGRDGKSYEIDEWSKSRTFRNGDQSNLLISDNHTKNFDKFDFEDRRRLSLLAWGIE